MNIVNRKSGFKREFKISDIQIKIIIRFVSNKTITTYLKAKKSLHATRISGFIYVFIIFFETKQMLKYTFYP